MGYGSNLWNAIIGSGMSVERDALGRWSYWMGKNPNFKITDHLETSLTNPAVFTAFDMRSSMFSRAKVMVQDSEGKEIDNDPFIDLLSNPNYCESQTDFLKKHIWFKGLGTNITKAILKRPNANIREIGNIESIEHLIPSQVNFGESNKKSNFIFSRTQKEEVSNRKISYSISGETHSIPVSELAFFFDVACNMKDDSMFKSPSRLDALGAEIKNIEEAQLSKHKNLVFSAKWLATNKKKEMSVTTNLEGEERNEIESGLFSKSMTATNADVSVENLAGDFRKLLLDDNVASDAMRIFGAYGINKDVLNWWMNGQTTYDNKQYGLVDWVQNSIQMEADDFANTWTTFFNYQDEGKKIVLDYSHLPIMQVLETKRLEGIGKQSEILEKLVRSGVALSDALRISGLDETEA